MSIANSDGSRSDREPKPQRPDRDRLSPRERIRIRDDRWLKTMRHLEMSIQETADYVKEPYRTVARGIKSALDRETLGYGAGTENECVQDLATYIQETYPIGTPIGDHPDVRAWFSRLDVPQLTRAELERMGISVPADYHSGDYDHAGGN